MKKFLSLLLAVSLTVESFALLGRFNWFFELFTHYTVYYALIGTALLLITAAIHRWKTALIFAVLISINLATFAPYLSSAKLEDAPEGTSLPLPTLTPNLSVLSQNFYYTNTNFDEFQTLLSKKDPDIFVIHEAGHQWQNELATFQDEYPFIQITRETGVHGIVVGSKNPGTFQEIPLGTEVGLQFIPEDQSYRLLAVHPYAPVTEAYAEERNEQFADIETYVKSSEIPTLVVGDFNCTPWSPYFQDLLETTGLKDSRLGFGIVPTWHAHNFLFQLPIDFILTTPQIETVFFSSTEKTDSDHLGIFALLHIEK